MQGSTIIIIIIIIISDFLLALLWLLLLLCVSKIYFQLELFRANLESQSGCSLRVVRDCGQEFKFKQESKRRPLFS